MESSATPQADHLRDALDRLGEAETHLREAGSELPSEEGQALGLVLADLDSAVRRLKNVDWWVGRKRRSHG